MAGSIQNTTILLGLESTAGTGATLTAAADAVAVRVSNLKAKITERFAERDVIAAGHSAPDQLPFSRRGEITFSVEAVGSGTAGTAPPFGKVLQACGFSETVTAASRVDYLLTSSGFKTASIWAAINNRLEKFVYSMGSAKVNVEVGKVVSIDFTFTGLVLDVAGAAPMTPTLTAWKRGQAAGKDATTQISIGGVTYSAGAISGGTPYSWKSCSIDTAMDVQADDIIGPESVGIFGRTPKATIVADLGGAAHAALKADMHAGTQRGFGFVHGTLAGYKFGVHAPAMSITDVSDEMDGNKLYDRVEGVLRPATANDEFRMFFI